MKFIISIVVCAIILLSHSILESLFTGYEVIVGQVAGFISAFLITLFIWLSLRIKHISWKLLKDEIKQIRINGIKEVGLGVKSLFAFLVVGIIINFSLLKPMLIVLLLFANASQVEIDSTQLVFGKPHHSSQSANNPYYIEIEHGSEQFTLKITAKYKRKIETTKKIESLHKGKFGIYYIP